MAGVDFLISWLIIQVNTEHELCQRLRVPNLTYAETFEAAFKEGPKRLKRLASSAGFSCKLILLLFQGGASCVYVVFISDNIKAVGDQYFGPMDIRLYMLYLLGPLILICWLRNFKYLAPASSCGNIMTLVCYCITFYYVLSDFPDCTSRDAVADLNRVPLFMCTVLFAMEAVGVTSSKQIVTLLIIFRIFLAARTIILAVQLATLLRGLFRRTSETVNKKVMPLKSEMKDPNQFRGWFGVLNCAMLPITVLYLLVGLLGYLKYGDDVKGSITLNLPPHEKLAQSVKLMLAFSVYICYAICNYVVFTILWGEFLESKFEYSTRKVVWEYVVRTFIVLMTFVLAVSIPNLELFISLIGALGLANLGIAFPVIMDFLLHWNQHTGWRFALFLTRNLLLMLVAVYAFFIGGSTTLITIYHKVILRSDNDID